ncbi:Nuclear receptor domain-containing protein [Caenorhabditis elegans]|uniref:Nuclear receptor domain-containing protein n=1 Tax=Caenorhabditis elegans TaxID=6239 RepID=O45842_CAEEL|nr:Nuclear receptor domain-containing protein [Caenorhabditis elegans]CAB03437.3 Nuclear receptor domain-containing protein [Caenorhabditis elegans]
MFFRRQAIRKCALRPCSGGEACYRDTPLILGCQFCRFQKCIEVGMNIKALLQKTSLESLINFISDVDFERCITFLNFYPKQAGYTIWNVVENFPIEYIHRSQPLNYRCWLFLTAVSTIDFMKKFPFVFLSNSHDQTIILRKKFVKVASFCEAFRVYLFRDKQLAFPDGSSILIEGLDSELGDRIKYRLVVTFFELHITNEEFLLLLVLLFSNPAIESLSQTGSRLLSAYQNYYSSSLLEYCMLTYLKNGPTRFAELLDVFQVLTNPEFQLDEIVKEGFNLL